MNYFDNLNKIIKNIENNLTEKIEYKELAKIIGTTSYTMQRIFAFLTGITLTEYIRKRRLSKAAEEILTSEIKIIDVALKYQYDSPISFSNAFKKMHGISPQTLRKTKTAFKTFPIIEFKPITETINELEYRIIELGKQTLYGVTTGIISLEDSQAIRNLYNKSRENKSIDFMIENSNGKELYYGASKDIYNDEISNKIQYYILGRKNKKDFIKLEIPASTWACFKLNTKEQKDILKLYNTIYTKWLPSSIYNEILQYPQLEIYYENNCEICIPVK